MGFYSDREGLPHLITNADVSPTAGIVYSKLNLTNSIVNADINAAAAIAYSKLNLTGSIVNADISAAAAIAYSKLNLTGSIVNADISAAAAIARSKIAAGTASVAVVNDGSGLLAELGYASANTASFLVARDGSGDFSAGTVNLAKLLTLVTTTSTAGQITLNGTRWAHAFGTNNTWLGSGAGNFTLTGTLNIGIGDGAGVALTSGGSNVLIGKDAAKSLQSGSNNVIVGAATQASNNAIANCVIIGQGASSANVNNCVILGNFAASTAANQFVCGSGNTNITSVFFGAGVTNSTAPVVTINGTGGSGSDNAGADLVIAGGRGTGAGTVGQILFKTSTVAGSSSTAQTLSTRGGWDGSGGFFINGTTSGTLTLKAAAATTSHTLTMPSAQGAAGSRLENDGSGGLSWSYGAAQAKTANYTLINTDTLVKVDSSGGAFSLTLPTAASIAGKTFVIVATAVGSNAGVDLKTTSSQTIGGLASANIILNTAGDTITVVSDGTNWQIANWNIAVGIFYSGNPTGTINGSTDNIYPTKVVDPNTDYATGTGIFTCRYAGKYSVNIMASISETTGSFTSVSLLKNGSGLYAKTFPWSSTLTNNLPATLDINQLALAAGDTLKIRFNGNGSPGFENNPGGHWFCLSRTSN